MLLVHQNYLSKMGTKVAKTQVYICKSNCKWKMGVGLVWRDDNDSYVNAFESLMK